jgi:hypothetical protein
MKIYCKFLCQALVFLKTQKGAELIGKILLFGLYIKKQVRGAELFPPNISSAPPPLRKNKVLETLKSYN